ncbi:MAG: FAD binding domain-containing protein [bacterium]|nr:FAD binding domain-containing protein [bacterium]
MWDLKEYRIAGSPGEAVAMMRRGPGKGVYIAGGTDLFLFPPQCDYAVDINHAGLGAIARTPDGDVFVGAAATLHHIATNPFVTGYAGGLLAQAAAHCGNRPVRSTATLGGNLCNALPSADLAPALLALDAVCYIVDEDSQESLPLEDFFEGPRRTVLGDRLLAGIALPAAGAGWRAAARRLTRSAEDIALVQVAVALSVADGRLGAVRIALGSVAPVPMRAMLAEAQLEGEAVADLSPDRLADAGLIAASECDPIDDHRASAAYRRQMVGVLTRRLLAGLLAEQPRNDDQGSAA